MGKRAKGILELKLNDTAVEFHTDEEDIIIPNLDTFIYGYSNTYGTIVYVKEKYFRPILEHVKRITPKAIKLIEVHKSLLIGFKVSNSQ
jgi:hypothetical protein